MSEIPLFYEPQDFLNLQSLTLNEATAKHVALVLRKAVGDEILLTNGKGLVAACSISSVKKKEAVVAVNSVTTASAASGRKTGIAIAPVKNTSRLEWFLEKATELGVSDFYLLQTSRTEKTHLRYDRLQQILVSAMLQSKQYHLPQLHEMASLEQVLKTHNYANAFVAHCHEGIKHELATLVNNKSDALIFIGPEGDFTADEIEACLAGGAMPVSLGSTRLRTETAALAAATISRLG